MQLTINLLYLLSIQLFLLPKINQFLPLRKEILSLLSTRLYPRILPRPIHLLSIKASLWGRYRSLPRRKNVSQVMLTEDSCVTKPGLSVTNRRYCLSKHCVWRRASFVTTNGFDCCNDCATAASECSGSSSTTSAPLC